MKTNFEPYYTGSGEMTRRDPPFIQADTLTDPRGYIAPPDLVSAVNVAVELGLPLLLTGEPGCGKSQLAHSLAWELGLAKPFTFNIKSDTQSRDLFYNFDTLGRFRAVHIDNGSKNDDTYRFLRMDALGLAIFHALGRDKISEIDPGFSGYLDKIPAQSKHSVVLIDEIDKAPREVPNDILNEIENMAFDIPEVVKANQSKSSFSLKGAQHRPIVVITSNRERELPEAFLRRCVYFHVELPPFRNQLDENRETDPPHGQEVTIESIIERRLKLKNKIPTEKNKTNTAKRILSGGVSFFEFLCSDDIRMLKKPSTAELLNWILLLNNRCDASDTVGTKQALFFTSAKVTLFKHQEDQKEAEDVFDEWLAMEHEG